MRKVIMFPLLVMMAAFTWSSLAAPKSDTTTLKYNFRNEDIVKLIEEYAKASGQKIIVDPQVRGKVTILNPEPITLDEAFNQLSTALMINGLAFSKQGDTFVVLQARSVQRNLIEVVTELPPIKPDKMITWMVKLKYRDADSINKELRILTSANGELVAYRQTNTIIISDYVSNLHRIAAILKQLDVPVTNSNVMPVKSN